jgi:hypothetical protein
MMETFSPEFAAMWLTDSKPQAPSAGGTSESSQSLSPSQQVALEELADRVTAARSVL